MKRIKRIAALLMAATLCLGLVACGGGDLTASEATIYVQGIMDRTYLGQYNEDYMDLVGTDLKTMEEYYRDGLEVEAETFCDYFEIVETSDELMEKLADFYAELYAHSKYEVSPASKLSSGGFACEVVIYPIDIIDLMVDDVSEIYDSIFGQYTKEEIDAMSDEAYAQLEVQWAESLVDLAYEKLPDVGNYEEPTYITVQVKQDDKGVWSLVDTDFGAIDAAIIAY